MRYSINFLLDSFNIPTFLRAFSYSLSLFFSPPEKKSKLIGRVSSAIETVEDYVISKSLSSSCSIIETSGNSSLRVFGNTFVIACEKFTDFGVEVVVKPTAAFSLPLLLLPPLLLSNKNFCVSDNDDGVIGGVNG